MAVEEQILDLSFKNTSGGTIPQFSVVHYDSTNAFGAVPPANANAGPVAGVNLSTDVNSTTGALTSSVQAGSSMQVRMIGVSRVIVAGATVIGAPLYVQGSSGKVDDARAGTDLGGSCIGIGMEAGTADGDLISCYLLPGIQPAFKKLAASVANSQASVAHGLPYVPQTVLVVPKGNAVIWISQAADGTNVYLTGSVAGPTNADVYVA